MLPPQCSNDRLAKCAEGSGELLITNYLKQKQTNLCPGDRRRHSMDNCLVVTVCAGLGNALCKNFPPMFSCLRRSDRRERDGMGHVCVSCTGRSTSANIRKVDERVFWPVTITSTLRMLFKQINLRGNERKRSSRHTASISLRFVPSVKVFS